MQDEELCFQEIGPHRDVQRPLLGENNGEITGSRLDLFVAYSTPRDAAIHPKHDVASFRSVRPSDDTDVVGRLQLRNLDRIAFLDSNNMLAFFVELGTEVLVLPLHAFVGAFARRLAK